jgi:4-amino-4-deoxy-L-arabinose transferase-like glycosyltransferase
MILGLVGIAIAMRLYGLGWPFDFDDYDEGVYWQTLRAMHAGFRLYDQIFYSQPPLFLISIYPFYSIFGQSIMAARAGIVALSLLGLLGAYMMGNALASRAGALAAVTLAVFMPLYLAQSQTLQAEGPATAFLFLSVGAALMWWERSLEKKLGAVLAVLCGAALAFGILTKLLNVTAFAPILMLIGWRIWASRRGSGGNTLPILAQVILGLIVAIITALIAFVPFMGSANALIDQVVKFHLAAENWHSNNLRILARFLVSNGALTIAAMSGAVLALVRRDWRVIPLAAWLTATIALLVLHAPLFPRHVIVLIPPLIAITVLGFGDLPPLAQIREIMNKRMSWKQISALLMGSLVCAATAQAVPPLYAYYHSLSERVESDGVRQTAQIAADLARVTTPNQWIITDGQFLVALTDRNTPPSLVDTSFGRIQSGYLTTHQLIEAASDPRVQAVLFATRRLASLPDFHGWVAQHFAVVRSYGPGIELWIR